MNSYHFWKIFLDEDEEQDLNWPGNYVSLAATSDNRKVRIFSKLSMLLIVNNN